MSEPMIALTLHLWISICHLTHMFYINALEMVIKFKSLSLDYRSRLNFSLEYLQIVRNVLTKILYLHAKNVSREHSRVSFLANLFRHISVELRTFTALEMCGFTYTY